MSRAEKLLRELCPDGVEYRNLEDCCTILDRKRKPVRKTARTAGPYPYYGANGIQDHVSDYIFDGTYILVGEDGSVITPAGHPVLNWASGKIWVNNHAHIVEEDKGVILRYLYHYLQTLDIHDLIHGNIPKLNQGDFRRLKILVPPLPVQEEIVSVLDRFAERATKLTTELTAELAARKRQYEYYRDDLLTFNAEAPFEPWGSTRDMKAGLRELLREHCPGGVEYKKLGEIASISRGGNLQKKDFTDHGVPCIHYGQIYTQYRLFAETAFTYITEESAKKQKYARPHDIVMAVTGENIEDICKCVAWLGTDDVAVSGHTAIIHHQQNPRYMSYYFHSRHFQAQKDRLAHGSKVVEVTPSKLNDINIPVPPLPVQEEIVRVLDHLEEMAGKLTAALSAEIAARQKQYEYYRDKLLTFKVKAAEAAAPVQ